MPIEIIETEDNYCQIEIEDQDGNSMLLCIDTEGTTEGLRLYTVTDHGDDLVLYLSFAEILNAKPGEHIKLTKGTTHDILRCAICCD